MLLFLLLILIFHQTFADYGDPSQQELALSDWACGIRAAYCVDAPLMDIIDPFRSIISELISQYCRNASACLLKKTAPFTADHIVILDGYPKRVFEAVQLRFIVVLPHAVIPSVRRQKPLLAKSIISDVLKRDIDQLASRLGWHIIHYEKYPKYEPITEFMNQALIPIGFLAAFLITLLAFWSSTLESSQSLNGDGWTISGANGKSMTPAKRVRAMIAAAEKDQQHQAELQHRDSRNDELVLNVKKLSSSKTPVQFKTPIIPDIVILSDMSNGNIDEQSMTSDQQVIVTTTNPSALKPSSLAVGSRRASSRRQSSIDEVMLRRARTRRHSKFGSFAVGQQRTKQSWKASSMMLRGFVKIAQGSTD